MSSINERMAGKEWPLLSQLLFTYLPVTPALVAAPLPVSSGERHPEMCS